MWREAQPEDDDVVATLCLMLNHEDPGPAVVTDQQVRRTLDELRSNPIRGKALVLDISGRLVGYALLISFWSNELGGEVCTVDEIFVAPEERGHGHATALLQSSTTRGTDHWWRRHLRSRLPTNVPQRSIDGSASRDRTQFWPEGARTPRPLSDWIAGRDRMLATRA